jgi:hypothetical protein
MMAKRIFWVLLVSSVALTACGPSSEPTTTTTTEGSGAEMTAPSSPWDGYDDAALIALVR